MGCKNPVPKYDITHTKCVHSKMKLGGLTNAPKSASRAATMVPVTQLKIGMIIVHNGDLYKVASTQHVAPGNWRAMVQTKIRNLRTGVQIEHRFNGDEKVERAILEANDTEYLYKDGDSYTFMNMETFEQITLDAETLGDYAKFLQPNCKVKVDLYDGKAVGIELPTTMTFKVVEADPSMRHATAAAQFKNATLENGMIIRVPAFIEAGDSVKVDPDSGEYVERA